MQQHLSAEQGGFTLLEVLLVVVLVGVITSIAMLGFGAGDDGRRVRDEADRLAALLEQVANEAVMQNQEFGLKIAPDGYFFLCLDEAKQRWLACTEDKSLAVHKMPEGMEIHILQDSRLQLPLASDDDKAGIDDIQDESGENAQRSARLYPDFLLLSSGEASPGSVEIVLSANPDIRSEIHLDELGRVSRDAEADESVTNDGRNGSRHEATGKGGA